MVVGVDFRAIQSASGRQDFRLHKGGVSGGVCSRTVAPQSSVHRLCDGVVGTVDADEEVVRRNDSDVIQRGRRRQEARLGECDATVHESCGADCLGCVSEAVGVVKLHIAGLSGRGHLARSRCVGGRDCIG